MRSYNTSHPWITFQADLRRIPYSLWIALGEIRSKCEHIAGVPLRPFIAQKFHTLFLAKGALATTAIEGNTLSEEEVIKIIEGKSDICSMSTIFSPQRQLEFPI